MSHVRIVIVVKFLGEGKYQAQLRTTAGGHAIFYSRRETRTSAAKRAAEEIFGPLDWQEAPEALKRSEPEVNQVAYVNR